MYVIFPADELILMTYGFRSTTRTLQPRPTLDCLREPQVPFGERSYTTAGICTPHADSHAPADPEATLPEPTSVFNYDVPHSLASQPPPPTSDTPFFSQSLPPTPRRRTSRDSLTVESKRLSVRSTRSRPPTPPQAARFPAARTTTAQTPTAHPMSNHNEPNMRATHSPPSLQPPRPALDRSSIVRGVQTSPLYQTSRYDHGYQDDGAFGAVGEARDSSPSILVEPPIPNTTATNPSYGHGWGRPMSPMDLPPEQPAKSPSSKASRLRPKLHIPLGRLVRQPSTEQRESNRLREDLQLHVENPIFNSENLRQRNFDAFFESGEPVYKLQPKTAPASVESAAASALPEYPGLYDSPTRGRRAKPTSDSGGGGGGGGLFARSPREERSLSARSKSDEHYERAHDERASSVGGTSGGTGVSQKGDRCPQNDDFLEK